MKEGFLFRVFFILVNWLSIGFLVYAERAFYRSWGFQSNGTFLKNITFVTVAEDCLHHCYINQNWKSFNTFELEDKTHKCQLFSSDICSINSKNGIAKNPSASVFFSNKIEECVRVNIIYNDITCLKRIDDTTFRLRVITNTQLPCSNFTLEGNQMLYGNRCLILGSRSSSLGTLSSDQCTKLNAATVEQMKHSIKTCLKPSNCNTNISQKLSLRTYIPLKRVYENIDIKFKFKILPDELGIMAI